MTFTENRFPLFGVMRSPRLPPERRQCDKIFYGLINLAKLLTVGAAALRGEDVVNAFSTAGRAWVAQNPRIAAKGSNGGFR
jgi:hypothetical protein